MTAIADERIGLAWLPDLIYANNRLEAGFALVCDDTGGIARIARVSELTDEKRIRLANRAMMPGMINAHSHAFQRVLRGRTEYRSGDRHDSFWTWREMMYSAATRLSPDDIYDASRMAFLEMALSGITAVGEFHYLHYSFDGAPYDDPNLLAKQVMRAAGDVGLRIALLRVAYARSGFQTEPNPRQKRFIERDSDIYLKNLESLICDLDGFRTATVREGSSRHDDLTDGRASATAWVGVAPHSVRAVPLDYLREVIAYAGDKNLKVHMHVAEQPAEVSACVEEYGRTPVALLDTEGLLSEQFTAVHAIHVTPKAIPSFGRTRAMVCACPTTERNLGDGVVPADQYSKHNVPICLGTDSHTQIDLLEDARELEYHLRLQKLERAVLSDRSPTVSEGDPGSEALPESRASDTAALLFDYATVNGARSIGAPSGTLEVGKPADFFTVDLRDPSVAGASPDDLLANIVFASTRVAVREVVIGGKPIVSEGQHLIQEEVIERFNDLQKRLWS
jgi:formimidoylglutamate deiminase